MTDYTAPAAFVLTKLHIRDPAIAATEGAPGRDATCGQTVCGQPMLAAQLWMLLDLEPGDAVCPACLGQPAHEQGALL